MAEKAAVIGGKAGMRVRLRDEIPLHGSLNIEGKRSVRYTLEPNRVTEVDPRVYEELKRKFGIEQERWVPDDEENAKHPHKLGQPPIMRSELKPGYIIEFLEG